jgi:hypothetical protein
VESGALYTVTTIFLLGFSGMTIGPIFAAALGQISVRFLPSFSFVFGLPVTLMNFCTGTRSNADYRTQRTEKLGFTLVLHA